MENQDNRTYAQLREEIQVLEKLAAAAQERELDVARQQILEIMRSYGLTAEQVLGGSSKKQTGPKAGGKVAAQWRDATGERTWTGRGRRPGWVDTEGVRLAAEQAPA